MFDTTAGIRSRVMNGNVSFDGEEEILRKLVGAMFELPSGTQISTVDLVGKTFGERGGNFSIDQLFRLAVDLPKAARSAGIRIGRPDGEPSERGLPFVFDMIIRHGRSSIHREKSTSALASQETTAILTQGVLHRSFD